MISFRIILLLLLVCLGAHTPLHLDAATPISALREVNPERLRTIRVNSSVDPMTGQFCEEHCDLRVPGFYPIDIKRVYNDQSVPENAVALAPGWWLVLDPALNQVCDARGNLLELQRLSPDGLRVLNSARFQWNESPESLSIRGCDGRESRYTFSAGNLVQVDLPCGNVVRYGYENGLLTLREDGKGGYLRNEYEEGSQRIIRQLAPLGVDETPVTAMRYEYGPSHTTVFNAVGSKTVYRYRDNHIGAIETYDGEALYRVEWYFWDGDQLLSYAVGDSARLAHGCRTFRYDSAGNCICTTLWGDLTGSGAKQFGLDRFGQPMGSSIESQSTYYYYQPEAPHKLLEVQEENGRTVTYRYEPLSGFLQAKFLWEGAALRQRLFCRYDENRFLIETICDDGYTVDPNEFSGVTERRVVTIAPKSQMPSAGLPVLIDEKYWDSDSGVEHLLRTTIKTYDGTGHCIREEYFNAEAENCGFQEYGYDHHGRLCSTIDGDGTLQTYQIEEHGLQQAVVSANGAKSGQNGFLYDFAGRLLSKQMKDSEGRIFTSSFRYNVLGQMTAAIDLYGNETQSSYDELGRCVATTYPQIRGAADELIRPEIKREYDLLDCVSAVIEANGFVTKSVYNVRGQPIEVRYPDGTLERFQYNLDGSLRAHINRLGVFERLDRDMMGRVTQKQLTGRNGEQVVLHALYDSFHLVGTVDPSGVETCYSYDGAGRVISAFTQWGQDESQRQFSYDANGSLQEAREWFGSGEDEYSRIVIRRDSDTNLVSTSVTDASHQELIASEYLRPPEGGLNVHHDISYCNELGQRVLQKIVTDALGCRTITIYDALGHIAAVTRHDPLGNPMAHQEFRYDGSGNCVEERNARIFQGEPSDLFVVQRQYGPMNRLEVTIEAAGSSCETVYRQQYNSEGQLDRLVKPNGIRLHYQYDGLGRLSEIQSSDGSIYYRYTYDASSRPVQLEDLVQGTSTRRRYNAFGQIVEEQLANGLTLVKDCDRKGRTTRLQLPDGTAIAYQYDAALLRSVSRLSTDGETVYTHSYTRYSPTGAVEKASLIGDLGPIVFQQDSRGYRTLVESSYWSQRIPIEGLDALGRITAFDVTDSAGSYRMRFSYDALGQVIAENGAGMCSYSYDSLGNRRSKGASYSEINPMHQLVGTASHVYTYDANGNRITKTGAEEGSESVQYHYDALDRLVAAESTWQRTEYTYDALHRRIAKRLFVRDERAGVWTPEVECRYLYDGRLEIGAADAFGRIQELRVLGLGLAGEAGAAVALELRGNIYAPIHDHRGSLVCLVDLATRQVAECSRTTAFGEEQLFNGAGQRISKDKALNPWRFASKRVEDEIGLIFYGRRFYDPEIGRWLTRDPLGNIDGPNDYAFVGNNPLDKVDSEGLFSIEVAWENLTDTAWGYLQGAGNAAIRLVQALRNDLTFITDIRDDALYTGHQLIGPRLWDVIGFYAAEPESGVVGSGELSDKLRFSHVNGILVTAEDALSNVALISQMHGGANIHYTYRPTAGWTYDFLNATIVKFGYASRTAYALADKWKSLIGEMGGVEDGGVIIHYAHSLGGAESECARHLLTPGEQSMIRVFTFGSPALLPSEGFQSVTNYVSRLDPVSCFDPVRYLEGFLGADTNIIFVGTYWGIPILDHLLVSDSYRKVLEELGRNFTAG